MDRKANDIFEILLYFSWRYNFYIIKMLTFHARLGLHQCKITIFIFPIFIFIGLIGIRLTLECKNQFPNLHFIHSFAFYFIYFLLHLSFQKTFGDRKYLFTFNWVDLVVVHVYNSNNICHNDILFIF